MPVKVKYFLCGMQIRQGTLREAIHPMKLLAEAYRKAAVINETA